MTPSTRSSSGRRWQTWSRSRPPTGWRSRVSREEDIVQAEGGVQDRSRATILRMKDLLAFAYRSRRSSTMTPITSYIAADQMYRKAEERPPAGRDRGRAPGATTPPRRPISCGRRVQDCVVAVSARSERSPSGGVEPGEFVGVGMSVLRITYLETGEADDLRERSRSRADLLGQAAVTSTRSPNKAKDGPFHLHLARRRSSPRRTFRRRRSGRSSSSE